MNKDSLKHICAAVLFFVGGIWGALELKLASLIGEASFVVLLVFTVFVALLIALMWKIEFFKASVGSIEVKLREIKQTETNIRELASAILEFVEADGESYKSPRWDPVRYQKAKDAIKALTS